ncbi:MAG: ABC transporter substrate-binding protein [Chloroflexota bacterium]
MMSYSNLRAIEWKGKKWQVVDGRHLLLVTCHLLLASLFLVGCQRQGETWQRVEETGVLRVGLDPTFPPFETAVPDDVFGLDVDLAEAIAADLGLEVQFTYFGYDGLYDALLTGQVDVLASALVIIPERERDFSYSDPYFNAGEILVVPVESDVAGMVDLNGRSVAVELGAYGHVEATNWTKRLADLTVVPFPSPEEALTAVIDGQADAVLIDSVSGRLFIRDEPRLQRVAEPVTIEPYALVVRDADSELLDKLNASLARLAASGELAKIISEWVG